MPTVALKEEIRQQVFLDATAKVLHLIVDSHRWFIRLLVRFKPMLILVVSNYMLGGASLDARFTNLVAHKAPGMWAHARKFIGIATRDAAALGQGKVGHVSSAAWLDTCLPLLTNS